MQTKKSSLIESIWNGMLGLGIGLIIWYGLVEPMVIIFQWDLRDLLVYQATAINGIYLTVNITKTWIIRRFFNSKEGRHG